MSLTKRLKAAAKGFLNPDRVVSPSAAETMDRARVEKEQWQEALPRGERVEQLARTLLMEARCIGGTMLGSALALMAAESDDRIASATFFAAQHDFKLAGDLLVFVDEEWINEISRLMDAQGGVLDGRTMSDTFNMLRSNEDRKSVV